MKNSFFCGLVAVILLATVMPAAAASSAAPENRNTPAPVTFTVGKATITTMQDMVGVMDLSIFQGTDEVEMKKLLPSGSFASTVNVFLVRLDGKNILVDTGFGKNSPEAKSALPELLDSMNVKPSSIDMVLLTHMHGDHIGGLLKDGEALFTKAAVMVSRAELAFWQSQAAKANSSRKENAGRVASVAKAYGKRLKTFDFDAELAPGLHAFGAVGHTPGHTMFALSSEDKGMIFWGDTVHGAVLQFPNPEICATYDMDMAEAVRARIKMMELAVDEEVPVAGAHLPYPGIGRVSHATDGRGYVYTPGMQ